MPDFRTKSPSRTCSKSYANYRSYKKYLIKDFSNRCGYCDGSDTWHGGYKAFHIDHFAPKDKFPQLEKTYSNLIYSCPACNNSKSNKWPSNDPNQNVVSNRGFLNPSIDDLNGHFERDDFGKIIGKTDIAKDMIASLNLNIDRHSVIWMLTKLEELIDKYQKIIEQGFNNPKLRATFEETHYVLLKIFFEYQLKLKGLNVL